VSRLVGIVVAAAVAGGLAGGLIGLLLGGHASGAGTSSPLTTVAAPALSATHTGKVLSPEAIYRDDAPAVVVITDTRTRVVPRTFFAPSETQKLGALGSGFVIDRKGDILTNDHVVQGSTAIRVGFSSGATYPARLVGADPTSDLAVVRVHAPIAALHPLSFDDSETVEVGDRAYAIGNPFGLDRTMTAGIVSATGRSIVAPDGLTIPNAIQTDAPINHGNSGGPLLDRYGRVIGISSQIQSGTVDANVGVGFAVPSNTAKTTAGQLIAEGHASHAWLGVEIETIDPSIAGTVKGVPPSGVTVVRVVKRSPAAKAGLEPATRRVTVDGVTGDVDGDSIVAVDGKPVVNAAQLGDLVALHRPGDRVTLEIVRGGATRTIDVILGNAPS
jgi:S1-C subfamily serine protease